ncbi:MAG: apolipoprotein N-acyltransferase, partial [Bdellovibrio sp. CG10_big_fil_rev_8_21_14_0_10_47_8]
FLQKSKGGKRAVVAGISSLLVLFYFAGQTRQEKWQSSDAELKTLIVQANIANFEKYQAERGAGYQQEIMDQFYSLTRDALNQHPDTDLVLWPETAFPEFLDDHAKHRFYPAQLRSFVQSINKPLILGAYSKDGPEVRRRKDYNALFLFNERGELTPPPYHKTQLLIFGEYAPLVEEFPILAKYNPGGEGFGRGTGPTLMQIGDIKLGPQICYESLDPQFSAQSTLLGSQILINATNDSWFGPRGEPFQHLYMTLARAIENRRPLIRSTNTGISSAILADGTILELSPIDQKWYGLYTIHYQKNPEITFYTKYGSWLWLVISFLLALTIFLGRNRARIERPRLD